MCSPFATVSATPYCLPTRTDWLLYLPTWPSFETLCLITKEVNVTFPFTFEPKLCPGPRHTEPPSSPPHLQSHPCLKELRLMEESGKVIVISARIKIVVYLNIDEEMINSA